MNFQSLHIDHGSFLLNVRKARNEKLILKTEEIKFKHDCDHVFNPAFVNNIALYRCYVGEQSINDGIYHVHKLQFNEIENNNQAFIFAKKENYQMVNMAYEQPIPAIEKRRGSAVGWSWIGAEDGRFFIHKDIIYIAFTAPSAREQIDNMRGMFIAKLKDAMSNKYIAKEVDNQIGYTRKSEKHWAFIGDAENNNINVIYQLEPFTLGFLDDSLKLLPVAVQTYSCLESSGHTTLNIATNIVKIHQKKDVLVLIYHVKGATYNPHVLLLDAEFPYAPIMTSRDPLEIKADHQDFVYVTSLSTERGTLEANRDDVLVMGIGLSDRGAAYTKLSVKELFALDYIMCNGDD